MKKNNYPFHNKTRDSLLDIATFIIALILVILFVFKCCSFGDEKNLTVPEENQKIMIMNEKGGITWAFM
jgi:hypothetical protein